MISWQFIRALAHTEGTLVQNLKLKKPLNFRHYHTSVPELIVEKLGWKISVATAFYKENKDLFKTDYLDKIQTLELLNENFSSNFVINNPNLISFPKKTLEERLMVLESLPSHQKQNSFLNLTKMSSKDFSTLNRILVKNKKKIKELSETFQCSLEDAAMLLVKYKFLLRSKTSTVQEKVNTLQKEGFSIDLLKKDIWVLTYTTEKLLERLEVLKTMNLSPIKTWMLRCTEDVLMRTKSLRDENELAMAPAKNAVDYICKRLKITESQVVLFASRHPPVLRVHIAKMKEIIDFLFSEGFTEAQIYSTPRILCHSISTIQSRLNTLKDKNYKLHTLSLLCISNKKFQDFLNKIDPSYDKTY